LQKKRDDPGTNKAQEIGTDSQISQQASLQYHPDLDSASTEPYFTTQDNSRNNTGAYDGFSTVKDALRSGYDSRITSQEFHGSEDVGQDEDEILVDEGPGPSVDESTKAGKLNTSYNPPLIVTSPFVGTVPPEDDDEDDSVTPTPKFSTPVAKATPEVTQPNIAESNTELVKGPAGITYLPVYLAQPDPAQLPSEIGFNSKSISRLAPEPEPKFYPPPPRATGSPNDKYRQVPRSGGAVRNPKHQPFKYQYGGPDQQLMGGALLSAYNQQQQFPFPLQKIGQSQYNSPAGTFNQNVNFVNQSQRLGSQQRQPFDPRSSSQGSYRERARGKYDVRKARGGYDKNTESNKYSSHSQYQNSSRPAGSGNSPTFPLDPALEVNYRNYRRQNNFNDGHGQYSNQNNDQSQYQNQNQYAEAPHFGYSAYGNVYGIGNGNDNGYPYTNPAPPAFNINSNYYAPSAFAAQEQEMIPSFSPEIGMMAPTQMAAPPTQEQLRQPFVPSPFAATFTPRFTDIRQEHAEQAQDQGQEYAIASEVGAFQYQLQGYGMLPLVPGPFANVMPLPMPTAAELISQAPHLIPYERPKPVVSMRRLGLARLDGRRRRFLERSWRGIGRRLLVLLLSMLTKATRMQLMMWMQMWRSLMTEMTSTYQRTKVERRRSLRTRGTNEARAWVWAWASRMKRRLVRVKVTVTASAWEERRLRLQLQLWLVLRLMSRLTRMR
jgi:hypothetical protein